MFLRRKMYKVFCQNIRCYSKLENPFTKTWGVLSKDMPDFFGTKKKSITYPEHADIVIIGGGFIGSSIAYWLKTRAGDGLSVVVLEKDITYTGADRNVSLGMLTQHYSLPENMLLAQHSAEFLRNARLHLGLDVDIQYYPTGQLVLASEKYAHKLEENVLELREQGIKQELLTVDDIRYRYPWINTSDVKLGCISFESEGYFDSWTFLRALVRKSKALGANYVNAEVKGFELEVQRDVLMEGVAPGSFKRINRVLYRTSDNQDCEIKFAACILAAGDSSGDIAKLAQIGSSDGLLSIPLPIKRREHKVFSFENNNGGIFSTPVVMDTTGIWLKPNGLDNNYLCGNLPFLHVDTKDMSQDDYLENIIKPALTNRIPDSKNRKINYYGDEVYDCNVFDDTGILGPHPYHNNLYIAAGFGKDGCVHAPGIGRAITELIIDSHFTTIDLTRFGFDRLLTNQPMVEFNIY